MLYFTWNGIIAMAILTPFTLLLWAELLGMAQRTVIYLDAIERAQPPAAKD